MPFLDADLVIKFSINSCPDLLGKFIRFCIMLKRIKLEDNENRTDTKIFTYERVPHLPSAIFLFHRLFYYVLIL